jgi:arginine/ornithine N-succinyltransferase beta subunit
MTDHLVLRPATVADADAIWELLSVAPDTVGMTSLPTGPEATSELCRLTAGTVADLAAGSFELSEGQRRCLLLVAVDPDPAPADTPRTGPGTNPGNSSGNSSGNSAEGSRRTVPDRVLGVTSCTFKAAVPNLAVRVQTGRTGEGLVLRSISRSWTRTELGSTYLAPEARRQGHGTLLSRGRSMLLHTVASQIPTTIASHLRGVFDDEGTAPFWTCFGRHFAPQWLTSTDAEDALSRDPADLEKLAGNTLPLEASVLPSLGAVNATSRPAFRLLLAEGLEPTGMFDPIDGGPTVVGQLAGLATRRVRRHGSVVIGSGGDDALVATTALGSFRVTRGDVDTSIDGRVTIDEATAERLGVGPGALVAASMLLIDP